MFFKTETIFKAYATEKAAVAYMTKHFANRNDVSIQFAGGTYYVVGA